MSTIPPKHTPDAAADENPEAGGGMVALYNAASHASAESFPVLKAFQDYIEAERSQARKRVMLLSIFFAVLMCVVVTGFLTAGVFMFRNMTSMQSNMTAMQSKLIDVALTQKPAPAPAPVVQTSPVIEESVRQMSRVTTELQSTLDKKLDGVSEIASKVNEKVSSQNGELEKLRGELKQMQEQSAKLKDELVNVKKEVAKKPEPAKAPVPAPVAVAKPAPAAAPTVVTAPTVAVAPAAVTPAAKQPEPRPAPAPKAEARDPRFPPAVKDPPVTPAGVTPPPAPKGMLATAIPVSTKNVGTIPWRVLIPE